MHIAIDAHSVGAKLAGNETYVTNLIESLAAIDQTNQYTVYVTRREAVERFQGRWPNFSVRRIVPHTPLIRIPIALSLELRRRPVDVLHVQFTGPPVAPCPVVVSIHDLSFEHLPETFNRRSRMQLKFTVRRTARNAAEIITISQHSKSDIIDTYNVHPDRVTITPLAPAEKLAPINDLAEISRVRSRYVLPDRYILGVGSIQPRKNLVRLIEAYASVIAKHGAERIPKLVLAGKTAWLSGQTFSSVTRLGLERQIIFTGYVAEEDLSALYSGADFFIYPSFFEGFGLPPLEAMQCGVPVIVGNRTSLPEVVGDAGLMVDPFDVTDIANKIEMLAFDPDLRVKLVALGLERARTFSWTRTAELTLGVYRRASRATKSLGRKSDG